MPSMPVNRRKLMQLVSLSGIAGLLNAQTTVSSAPAPVLPPDFEAAIQRTREASVRFGNGDPEPMKMAYSHAKDALIMGALGGYEQGGDQVRQRLDWAAKHFRDTRNQSFERLAAGCDTDFGYEIFLEKSESREGESTTFSPMTLRVTHLFRRESGQWKLIQRHADPLKPRA